MTSTSVCAAVRDIFHVFAAAFLSNNRFSVFPFQSFLHGLQYSDLCHFLLAAKSLSNTHTHTHTQTTECVWIFVTMCPVCMHACMCFHDYVRLSTDVSKVCPDTLLSFRPDAPCAGFWPSSGLLIKEWTVSVFPLSPVTLAPISKGSLSDIARLWEEIKITFKTSPWEEYWNWSSRGGN